MKSTGNYQIALVTAPDWKTARKIARSVLTHRLAACVNLVPQIESHYWWKGKIESGREILLILKTVKSHLDTLEQLILRTHPYDTPEFIVVPLKGGNQRYLDWLTASCKEAPVHR